MERILGYDTNYYSRLIEQITIRHRAAYWQARREERDQNAKRSKYIK